MKLPLQKILNNKLLALFASAFVYFLICLSFKNIIVSVLLQGKNISNLILTFFYVKNTGAAFSILSGMPVIVTIISIALLLVIFKYIAENINKFSPTEFNSFSLLIGGIISNLTERLADGFVTDYIKLNFINFPIFNLADIFITCGAILLMASVLRNRGEKYE